MQRGQNPLTTRVEIDQGTRNILLELESWICDRLTIPRESLEPCTIVNLALSLNGSNIGHVSATTTILNLSQPVVSSLQQKAAALGVQFSRHNLPLILNQCLQDCLPRVRAESTASEALQVQLAQQMSRVGSLEAELRALALSTNEEIRRLQDELASATENAQSHCLMPGLPKSSASCCVCSKRFQAGDHSRIVPVSFCHSALTACG